MTKYTPVLLLCPFVCTFCLFFYYFACNFSLVTPHVALDFDRDVYFHFWLRLRFFCLFFPATKFPPLPRLCRPFRFVTSNLDTPFFVPTVPLGPVPKWLPVLGCLVFFFLGGFGWCLGLGYVFWGWGGCVGAWGGVVFWGLVGLGWERLGFSFGYLGILPSKGHPDPFSSSALATSLDRIDTRSTVPFPAPCFPPFPPPLHNSHDPVYSCISGF